MTARGLTWDHPRGYDALAAAATRANAAAGADVLTWEKQPLEGFESAPITDLTERFDLVVLDHPHIGEAVACDCLIPLEDLYSAAQIATWAERSVGPSFASYRWQGRHWALPLDVATQVLAYRADRVTLPGTWDEIEDLAQRQPVALSMGGPHAYLNLISMAAGNGFIVRGPDMLPEDVALPILDRLGRLARLAPAGTADLNPIKLLEAMSQGDDIALVPLVFGYVTYARAPHRVTFVDSIRAPGGRGSVLGGTGIAFSRRSQPSQALLEHIAWLMTPEVQRGFIPEHGGQPSARTAWTNAQVNADWGHFYAATQDTAEHALLRPRFDGFPAFTTAASAHLRDGFTNGASPELLLSALRTLWRDARARARGDLDDERI